MRSECRGPARIVIASAWTVEDRIGNHRPDGAYIRIEGRLVSAFAHIEVRFVPDLKRQQMTSQRLCCELCFRGGIGGSIGLQVNPIENVPTGRLYECRKLRHIG